MANKILAILEQRDKLLKRSAFETAATAAKLSKELSLESEVIVVGSEVTNLSEIGKYGISKVTHFKNDDLLNYSPSAYTKLIADYATETDSNYLIFANTAFGKDLAPRVSTRINAGLIVDCIKLDSSSGDVVATRPVYAGKALIDVKLKSAKKVFTIRPNVFKAEPSDSSETSIDVKEVTSPDLSTRVVEIKKSEGKLDVAEADIIVSGGRGMKGAEHFHLIEELADVLGAAVGASRAVVDAGWRPHQEQVGQTGKTVSPSLYVACGISGAIQHLAGVNSSKCIVVINKDPEAPFFKAADYGIVGDAFEVVPKLNEALKAEL